jgi:CheY-like chemotaxis protein
MGASFMIELPLYLGLKEKDAMYKQRTEATELQLQVRSEEADSMICGGVACSAPRLRNRHILVVDDVLSNSKMLVHLLERAGHKCASAINGKECIKVFMANQEAHQGAQSTAEQHGEAGGGAAAATTILVPLFDTILMDFEMPVMNGPEATRRLREMGCTASIIGITGNVLREDVAFFMSNGADHVLPKPVNMGLIEAFWASQE